MKLPITELAQLVGTLVASLPGVQFGKLQYRNLEIEKNVALRERKGSYEARLSLFPSAKEGIAWWIGNVVDKAFNPISHGNPVIEITIGASKKGWDGYLMTVTLPKTCGPLQKASCTLMN